MENNAVDTNIKTYKIINGDPTEKDLEIINEMILKGFYYGRNIPKGIEWEREGSGILT